MEPIDENAYTVPGRELGRDMSSPQASYDMMLAQAMMGDSLHPGELELTEELAGHMALPEDSRVLDVGAGLGATAAHLASIRRWDMTGLDIVPPTPSADTPPLRLLQGDATALTLPDAYFDGVTCECSLNLVEQREQAVREIARVLRPGGRVGISDVAIATDDIPLDLQVMLQQTLCSPRPVQPDDYVALLENAGLRVTLRQDASSVLRPFLHDVANRLFILTLRRDVGQDIPIPKEAVDQSRALLSEARRLVIEGSLTYWLFVAEKPA